ncbi:MAG: chemotaxis protein CheW [Candidatus Methylomirabilia bacterium]
MAKGMQIVVFSMGRELFGVSIEGVREIVRVPEITAIPDAPPFLEGMINLRGRILPVIDLRRRLKLSEGLRDKHTRVLIIEDAGKLVGLLVDSVSEVLRIPEGALEPPPEMISSIGVEYLSAIAKSGGRLISLLDFHKVLGLEDLKRATAASRALSENQAA